MDMVDRLQEVQYELTDRLAYFLCGKKPDHRTGQHFIIPELSDRLVNKYLITFGRKFVFQ